MVVLMLAPPVDQRRFPLLPQCLRLPLEDPD